MQTKLTAGNISTKNTHRGPLGPPKETLARGLNYRQPPFPVADAAAANICNALPDNVVSASSVHPTPTVNCSAPAFLLLYDLPLR